MAYHPDPSAQPPSLQPIRLNKYLAQHGVAARRKADELILAGRVSVNGTVVKQLGTKIVQSKDIVLVDAKPVATRHEPIVYRVYKPVGVVSTMHDEQGRLSLRDLIPEQPAVFPVGRLDRMSEGLLIMTNDGDLALRLAHPRYRQLKTYRIWIHKPQSYVPAKLIEELQGTRIINGKRRAFEAVQYIGVDAKGIMFEVSIREGIYHEVKRLVDRAGLTVARLIRIQHGSVTLGTLQPGAYECLTDQEYHSLRRSVE